MARKRWAALPRLVIVVELADAVHARAKARSGSAPVQAPTSIPPMSSPTACWSADRSRLVLRRRCWLFPAPMLPDGGTFQRARPAAGRLAILPLALTESALGGAGLSLRRRRTVSRARRGRAVDAVDHGGSDDLRDARPAGCRWPTLSHRSLAAQWPRSGRCQALWPAQGTMAPRIRCGWLNWRGQTCHWPGPTRSNGARAARHLHPAVLRGEGRGRRLLLCPAGREPAAEAEDQLSSRSSARSSPAT
jgi:hypothetical protein